MNKPSYRKTKRDRETERGGETSEREGFLYFIKLSSEVDHWEKKPEWVKTTGQKSMQMFGNTTVTWDKRPCTVYTLIHAVRMKRAEWGEKKKTKNCVYV